MRSCCRCSLVPGKHGHTHLPSNSATVNIDFPLSSPSPKTCCVTIIATTIITNTGGRIIKYLLTLLFICPLLLSLLLPLCCSVPYSPTVCQSQVERKPSISEEKEFLYTSIVKIVISSHFLYKQQLPCSLMIFNVYILLIKLLVFLNSCSRLF